MQRRRRWSNRNASSFPQLTHSHAARLRSGSHKAHPPVDLTRDLGVVDGAALSGTRTTQARGLWRWAEKGVERRVWVWSVWAAHERTRGYARASNELLP